MESRGSENESRRWGLSLPHTPMDEECLLLQRDDPSADRMITPIHALTRRGGGGIVFLKRRDGT